MHGRLIHRNVLVHRSAERLTRAALIPSRLESRTPAIDLGRANQQIDVDARRVGDLQRSLRRLPLTQVPGLQIAANDLPYGCVGGDLYDLFPLNDGLIRSRWCMFLADASGHGPAAAAVAAMVQAILRAHPPHIKGSGDLLAHVNRQLCRKKISGFVTAFLGIYDPSTRELTYACAGHPPPLLKASGGVSRLDTVASCPLGIVEEEVWADATVRIQPGDTLLLYTDGITEARDPDNDMFSEERLQFALKKCGGSPAAVIECLENQVAAYRQGRPAQDDQTLMVIRGTDLMLAA